MEATQDYGMAVYRLESTGDQPLVLGCKAATHEQGKPYSCRLTFFTLRLGIIFHYLTYRDVVIPGSGLLSRLLAHIQPDGLAIHACDISPIELITNNKKLFGQYDWVPWTLQFLQFAHDRPDGNPLPNGLKAVLSVDCGISDLIDLHTVATFFEIDRLQRHIIALMIGALKSSLKNYFLIFSDSSTGSAQFRQINIQVQLEQTAGAIERAAGLVPRDSYIWILSARYFLTMRQVLDGTDSGEQARKLIARLNPTVPFAHACLEVSLNTRPASLKGVFQAPVDWNLQCEVCSCTGCSEVIFARDLVGQKAEDLASGTIQKYALVNPFDGYRTVFCDFCRKRCGVPWAGGNTPCVPHE